jgi:hypothetical protein
MRSMSVGLWVVGGIAGLVAAINAVTMKRLWASPIFERPQKIAQSVLLWLIPGSFFAIRQALVDHLPRRATAGDGTGGEGGEVDYEGGFGGHVHTHGGGDVGGGGDGTVGGF